VRSGAVLPVTAFDRANVTQLAIGQLAATDTQVNTSTGTVMLRADFTNSDEALFPSQFVNVIMLLDTLKDVVTVPVRAVQRGAPGNYVYLVGDDDTVSVHSVTLGAQDGDFFAVTAGLSPGDRVVTDGADRLRDGAKVSIPDTASTPPAAGEGRRPGDGNGHRTGTHEHGNGQHHKRPQPDDSSQPKPDGTSPGGSPASGP
jgi:multidrug efflux system membrane fusion protein